jgi:hypothetical protein
VLKVAVLSLSVLRFAVLKVAVLSLSVLRFAVLQVAVLRAAVLKVAVLKVAVPRTERAMREVELCVATMARMRQTPAAPGASDARITRCASGWWSC